jgi:hypothetical protein
MIQGHGAKGYIWIQAGKYVFRVKEIQSRQEAKRWKCSTCLFIHLFSDVSIIM